MHIHICTTVLLLISSCEKCVAQYVYEFVNFTPAQPRFCSSSRSCYILIHNFSIESFFGSHHLICHSVCKYHWYYIFSVHFSSLLCVWNGMCIYQCHSQFNLAFESLLSFSRSDDRGFAIFLSRGLSISKWDFSSYFTLPLPRLSLLDQFFPLIHWHFFFRVCVCMLAAYCVCVELFDVLWCWCLLC